MRLFILKLFLCLSGLLFGVSILTETAFLQNSPQPQPEPTAVVTATPRPKKKSSANTTIRVGNGDGVEATPVSNMTINAVPPSTPLPANSTVRGRVFYADTGRAVKRAPIMLMREKGIGGPGNSPSGLTDGDGNFQIKNIQAGTYYPMINSPGVLSPLAFVDFSKARGGKSEQEEFEKASEGFEKIVVDGITDIDVQIPARRGGAIGGRVLYDNGDPAIGVKVEILRKVKDKFLPVIPNFGSFFAALMGGGVFQTDDRGVYRFSGLPSGEYMVKITENISHGESAPKRGFDGLLGGGSSLLSIFYPAGLEPQSATLISVEPGQEITEINLTIPSRSLYKIEGKIVSRKDKTPVEARITIKREGEEEIYSIFNEFGSSEQGTQTDGKGNWKFKELPKGNYKLLIEPIQNENEYTEYSGNSNSNAVSNVQKNLPPKPKLAKKIYKIGLEDKDLSDLVIELGAGATITGTISVENNQELPQTVVIRAINEASGLDAAAAFGEFSVTTTVRNSEMPDKNFRLENIVEGKTYFYVQQDEEFYVKSAKAGGVDLIAGALELKDGETIANAQIILSKETGTIKGKILDEKNEPLKDVEFLLVPTDAGKQRNTSFYRDGKSNEKGEFEKKVAPGEYALIFADRSAGDKKIEDFFKWLAEAVKDAQKVSVEAGRSENLIVRKIKK